MAPSDNALLNPDLCCKEARFFSKDPGLGCVVPTREGSAEMCGVNHNLFAYPGYLIDVKCESMAAKVLFTRMLNRHAEIGLTPDQVMGLIALNAEYQAKLVAIRIEFAKVTERLEHKSGRLDAAALRARQALLDEHVRLFRAEEELFFEYGARGHDLLTDEQIDTINAWYHAEKDAALDALSEALNGAVGPRYKLVPVVQS